MKTIFLSLAFAVLLCGNPTAIKAQSAKDIGMICLNPVVPENDGLGKNSTAMLTTKLQQIATANGMSGAGFDNRFIITSHIQKLKSEQTQTMPQKNAVQVSIGIYVGDGLDGTLYSSFSTEAKGIGSSEDQAIAAAIKKLTPNLPELQMTIARGKGKILEYYDRMSPNIIKTAKASAAAGRYDEAMNMLFAIPMTNKDFQTAQSLIAQYGRTSLEKKNLDLVRQARSAWSSDPTEGGAGQACAILDKLEMPSTKVQAEAKSLQAEMTARIKAMSDREFQLEKQKVQNEKDVQIATVRAAASVAKAYAQSRPKVIFRYYWW